MDSARLHWAQTGRSTAPTEFITTKVLAKYGGPIVDIIHFNNLRYKYREVQELISVSCEIGGILLTPAPFRGKETWPLVELKLK